MGTSAGDPAAGQAGTVGYMMSFLAQAMEIGQSLGEPPSLTSSVLDRYPSQVSIPSPATTLRTTLPLPAATHCGL